MNQSIKRLAIMFFLLNVFLLNAQDKYASRLSKNYEITIGEKYKENRSETKLFYKNKS